MDSPSEGSRFDKRVTAILCVGGRPEDWGATFASLRRAGIRSVALTSSGALIPPAVSDSVEVAETSLADAAARELRTDTEAIFVVTTPVVVPTNPFETAMRGMGDDIRIASVSFFSNNGNYLSFPDRNAPAGLVANGHDEENLTRALRTVNRGRALVPIPVPAGGGVLFASPALRSIGGFDPAAGTPELAVIDAAMRSTRRGFRQVLDATTFVVRPLVSGRPHDALNDPGSRAWLQRRHPSFPALYDWAKDSPSGPLADAIALRRAAVFGLRLVIDGGCLGPYEMGTQSAILGQIFALAEHPGVRKIVVGTPRGQVPDYARNVLLHPKVRVCPEEGSTFPGAGEADIVHRPFQPAEPLPFEHWRRIARRTVLTLHDLIAYDNGSYFDSQEEWMRYRAAMVSSTAEADTVVAISNDTAESIYSASLPLGANGVSVVENGTDHLRRGRQNLTPPLEMVESQVAADPFILVLGASYAHKNRDLAIRAWQELRHRGSPLRLVLAGVVVPFGSTRNEEALVGIAADNPITLADVTSAERDWLLEHAALVLYPTSAEGFGLVPFEAAVFGTPTLFVGFGPLAEILPDIPMAAIEWTPEALADSIGILLEDPDLIQAQIDTVKANASELTWRRCADGLVDAYLTALATPSIHVGS